MLRVDIVAAARPNFMKVAPLYHAITEQRDWCKVRLVHTGQHYDANMSESFFRDLRLPPPDVYLGVGSGSHAQQTASVMVAYEQACHTAKPDWVIVVGDVNSTMACALVASKLGVKIAHLEAGLRSGDRAMPEEINRLVTDAVSDLLWTPSPDADQNLLREGVPLHKIHRVGNIMIDSLEMMRVQIERAGMVEALGLQRGKYGVVTLHRPSNVDSAESLAALSGLLKRVGQRVPVVFPVHPRTKGRLEAHGLIKSLEKSAAVRLIEPASYVNFMSLVFSAAYVLTDSGGVQEETTYLGIPCLTLRENTERPITVTQGTNLLVKIGTVEAAVDVILSGDRCVSRIPDLWDGKTAPRIVESLKRAAFTA